MTLSVNKALSVCTFLVGGPGSRHSEYCNAIAMMYPEVVHVAMGDLLRERVQGTPEQKWLDIMDMMRDGKMAPEVLILLCL